MLGFCKAGSARAERLHHLISGGLLLRGLVHCRRDAPECRCDSHVCGQDPVVLVQPRPHPPAALLGLTLSPRLEACVWGLTAREKRPHPPVPEGRGVGAAPRSPPNPQGLTHALAYVKSGDAAYRNSQVLDSTPRTRTPGEGQSQRRRGSGSWPESLEKYLS